jgi:methylated-DNA-[protein]-cysteine S-methyltransferase
MCAELFKAAADIHATVVPYKGTAPLTNDLVGGHVPVGFGVIPPALGNVQSGTLRAVAVTSRARTKLLPDVPTFDESGLPGFYAVLNYGLLAPAGMPAEIIARLSQELGAALHGEEVRQRIAADGGDVLTSTAEEYAADIDRDEKQWSALVRKLGFAGGVKAMHSSYALFDTAFGTCALAWNERGITRLRLPEAKPAVLEARMAARGRERGIPTVAVADAMAEVRRYFGGEQTSFSEIVLDLAGCEPFDRAIYAALRRIRWGTTASYGELAGAAGAPKAARAVGRAMGRNPVPIIIPCHRVITADGRIGGFSAPGGVDTKDRLHRLEGIVLATDAPLLRLMA